MSSTRQAPLRADQVARLLFENAQRQAEKRGKSFTIQFDDVYDRVRKGVCERTGIPFDTRRGKRLPFRASIDRVDNDRGYEPDNIQLVVLIYNMAKFEWSDADVIRLANALAGNGESPDGFLPDSANDDTQMGEEEWEYGGDDDLPENRELKGPSVTLADVLKAAGRQL